MEMEGWFTGTHVLLGDVIYLLLKNGGDMHCLAPFKKG